MRKEFELTDEQYQALMEACRPTVCIKVGSYMPTSPQENANRAWWALGDKLGFDYMTVRPVSGKGDHFFTAEVKEAKP